MNPFCIMHRPFGRSAHWVLALTVGCSAAQPAPTTSSKSITVGDKRVSYLTAGPDDGQVVLLLHGGRFTSKTWQETKTLPRLAKEGYRAVAVDLPGFGDSASSTLPPEDWLGQLIETLKLERPVILSASMSGRFALPFVTRQADRVSGFVAVAPVAITQHQANLANITVPILAIWGENDTVIPQAHADLLVANAPEARKVVIAGAGHALYLDKPDEFHDELIRFMKGLGRPPSAITSPKKTRSEP